MTKNGSGETLRSFHYTLAPTGHRLQVDEQGLGEEDETTRAYTHDERNRLTSINGQPLTWDAAGRLLAKPGVDGAPGATYAWWTDDRLLEAHLTDGTTVRTAYDVGGKRIETEQGTTGADLETIAHLVDDSSWLSQDVADIGPEGLDSLYIRAGDQLLGLVRDGPGSDRYYHLDGLGSVRALTDPTGIPTGTLDYTAFGERLAGSDSTQVYCFAGEPWSIAGMAYHRARWMDPTVGRFLSRDPFAGWPGSPVSQHGYGYAENAPTHLIDPTGLFFPPLDFYRRGSRCWPHDNWLSPLSGGVGRGGNWSWSWSGLSDFSRAVLWDSSDRSPVDSAVAGAICGIDHHRHGYRCHGPDNTGGTRACCAVVHVHSVRLYSAHTAASRGPIFACSRRRSGCRDTGWPGCAANRYTLRRQDSC